MPKIRSKLIRKTATPVGPKANLSEALDALLQDQLGAGPTPPAWKRLKCPVPKQEQSNWCWCATTLGVRRFFKPADPTKQCEAANRILQRTDACTAPTGPDVNIPYYLDRALDTFGHLRVPIVTQALALAQIEQEIDAGVPIGTRIGWSGGGGHFMVIDGYLADAVPRVAIHDPIYGRSDMDYDVYRLAYQGTGSWTHSYLIK